MSRREITEDEEKDLLLLAALEDAGVDQWDGWGYARRIYHQLLKENGFGED